MLGMKKQQPSVRSAVGPGMRVQGAVTFQDGLQIDGTVLGNVIATSGQPSMLIITESGRIEGGVSADQVVIGGIVVGPVEARESLELLATARVQGDVRYLVLEMAPGAVIAGQLQPQLNPPTGYAAGVDPRDDQLGSPSAYGAKDGLNDDQSIRQFEPKFDI